MDIVITLAGSELNDPKLFAELVTRLCESLIPVAQLQVKHLPALYKSGVRYREEAKGYESFTLPSVVCARGFGDCAHLAVWRCAELRNTGEFATIRIKWLSGPSIRMFHVQVRRANGDIEDPSQLLGMPCNGAV